MRALNEKFGKIRQELRRRWLILSVTLVALDSVFALLFLNLFHFRERTAFLTLMGLVLFEVLFLILLFIHSIRRPNAVALAKLVENIDPSFENGLVCAVEKELIAEALKRTHGVKEQAARLLKINRTTLIEKIRRNQLEEESV